MGAAELLERLHSEGLHLAVVPEGIAVRPSERLTDAHRHAIRAHKPELLALLAERPTARPYRLSARAADRCHTPAWSENEIARFVHRVQLFMRRGFPAGDADDLAERLVLRDREGDDMHLCVECRHYRPGRCGNHRSALPDGPEIGIDLATRLQRCPGFTPTEGQP